MPPSTPEEQAPEARDTSRTGQGMRRVKPLDELPAPVRELVAHGAVGQQPFVVLATADELRTEQACLARELAILQPRWEALAVLITQAVARETKARAARIARLNGQAPTP